MMIVPPPGGSRNACAQAPAGDGTAVSAWPFRLAFQPPDGSASSSVPPACGAVAPLTPSRPDGSAVIVPSGWTTRTRAGVWVSRHSSKAGVDPEAGGELTGRSPATPSISRARSALTGEGIST